MMKNEIVYIRVFATLLVVLGHSWLYNGFSGFEVSDIPGAMTGSFLYSINHFIYTFHMPIFFALSGFLLELSNKRRGNIKAWEFLKKKSFRLLFPFFIITLFYCLPVKAFVGLFEGLSFTNIVYSQFVQANNAHTWFLLALFWCMLMGLIVSFVDLNKNKKYLFLLILLIICIHIIGIPNRMKAFDVFCLAKGLRYSIFFVGGYFISKYMRITPPPYISYKVFLSISLCLYIFRNIALLVSKTKEWIFRSKIAVDITRYCWIVLFHRILYNCNFCFQ